MLGRFQPFHEGHFELFKKILEKTGQVIIMVRDCDELMHQNGRLYKSLWSIHNLKKTENFVEFQFNDIINNMDEVIKRIFTFLNLEPEKLSKEVTKFNFDGTVYDDSVLYGPLHNLQPDPDPHNYKDFLTSAVIEKYKHFDGL